MPYEKQEVGKLGSTVAIDGDHTVDFLFSEPSNKRIYFNIVINHHNLSVLFDSGSGISVMRPDLAVYLNLQISNQLIKNIKLVNKEIITLTDSVTTDVIYNDIPIELTFYLMDMREDIILGMDFYTIINECNDEVINFNFGKSLKYDLAQLFDNFELYNNIEVKGDRLINDRENRQLSSIIMNREDFAKHDIFYNFLHNNRDKEFIDTDNLTETECIPNLYLIEDLDKCEQFEFHIGTKDVSERQQILKLLNEFEHLFAFKSSDLRSAIGIKHSIETGDAKPIKQRNYRYGYKEKEEISKQVNDMLEGGIIEEGDSPWTNPIVLVKQKDKYRFCLDYRKLNAVTKPHCFPLPIIEDLLDQLEGKPILSIFDLKSGFFQIEVEEMDREKTAFMANGNVYLFKKMPFGLINAPSTFQKFMQNVLKGIIHKFVSVYIDDVVVYSKTVEEHLIHLREVFTRLDKHDLRLHPDKSRFLCEEIKFLLDLL